MSKKSKNLADMIDELPTRDIGNKDLKALLLQLVLDVEPDSPDNAFASRSNVKLNALKILADIVKAEKNDETNDDLINILTNRKKT